MPAIQATFQRRQTNLPVGVPLALTPEFTDHPIKLTQWSGFIRNNKLDVEGLGLEQIAAVWSDFLQPILLASAAGEPFIAMWPPSGPWRSE